VRTWTAWPTTVLIPARDAMKAVMRMDTGIPGHSVNMAK
jgi:hypothetical protein